MIVQEWTVENRLAVVTNTVTGEATRFVYDGDGNRIARQDPTGLTVNVGAVEVEIGGAQRLTTTYYFAGGQRIAMRKDGKVTYLHGDHLGSASLTTDASGAKVSEMRYTPFGETRFGDAPTDRRFTGQREEDFGWYDYGARFYSPSLGRFVSADTIVPEPGNPQSLNRYSYVLNSPLKYTDPTGHYSEEEIMQTFGVSTWDEVLAFFNDGGALAGLWGWLEILRQAQDGDSITYARPLFDKPGIGPRTNGRYRYPYNGGWFKRNESGQIQVYSGIDFKAEPTHTEFAQSHQEYWLYRPIPEMPGGFAYVFSTYAGTKYYHHFNFDASKVNWVDVTLDTIGLTSDIITAGVGGRGINALQVAVKSTDMIGVHRTYDSNFADGSLTRKEKFDLAVDILGVGVPFLDAISLISNFANGVSITP